MSAAASELEFHTTAEVADKLRTTRQTVYRLAAEHRVGVNLGGSAGLRFSDRDIELLLDKLRPAPMPVPQRRRRRRST